VDHWIFQDAARLNREILLLYRNRLLPALEGLSYQSLLVEPLGTWTTCCPSIIFPGKLPCDRERVFLNLLHQHAAMHRDVPTFELRCPFRGTMNRSAILHRHQSLFQVQPRLSTGFSEGTRAQSFRIHEYSPKPPIEMLPN
jgi:hypothetical protein